MFITSIMKLITKLNITNIDIKSLNDMKNKPTDLAYNGTTQIEQSWIYAFCMKCRGEDNTPSWEPNFWQKCCPFPLCPSFRQFARLWSIIIIGKYYLITFPKTPLGRRSQEIFRHFFILSCGFFPSSI